MRGRGNDIFFVWEKNVKKRKKWQGNEGIVKKLGFGRNLGSLA